jgi:hypothetical protein
MIYNLNNKIEAEQAQQRLNWLIKHGKKVEITEKRYNRTLKQNAYLHVILSYYGTQTGYTLEEVKQDIFKRGVCANFFRKEKNGIDVCRSTSDLNTKELTYAIERFRNHAAVDLGINLPQPHEEQFLAWCQEEIDRHQQYL